MSKITLKYAEGARKISTDMNDNKRSGEKIEVVTHPLEEYSRRDERGWVVFPWKKGDPPIDPATVHVVHIAPGMTRGNHYHPRVSEWLCPLDGEGVLAWRSPASAASGELVLEPRSACVRIPAGVRHAVINTGGGDLLLIAARERDPEGDYTVQEKV
jgi:oxalate decarboxylase/phosphoglucose isomerase-like protein (cupin superfamily)